MPIQLQEPLTQLLHSSICGAAGATCSAPTWPPVRHRGICFQDEAVQSWGGAVVSRCLSNSNASWHEEDHTNGAPLRVRRCRGPVTAENLGIKMKLDREKI